MRISPIRVWDVPYAYTHIGRPYMRMGQHFVPHECYIALPCMISYVAIFCHFMQILAGLPASKG